MSTTCRAEAGNFGKEVALVRVGVVGMGKMGLSHLSVINAHPDVEVTAICDSATYVLDVLGKYTGLVGFTDYEKMLAEAGLDAVLIATPSVLHAPMVRAALNKGLHVFYEKPFCLSEADGAALARLATEKQRVCQVGYHNRFVGSFREVSPGRPGGHAASEQHRQTLHRGRDRFERRPRLVTHCASTMRLVMQPGMQLGSWRPYPSS